MDYIQLRVTCKSSELETVCAVMSMIDSSLQIEDYSDIEENLMTVYGELIDEDILNSDKSIAKVSVYLGDNKSVPDALNFLKERFKADNIDAKFELVGVKESDWVNEWKKFYHTLHIGKNIVVTPPWEKYDTKPGETLIIMDSGMAFGTGTHETTKLALMLLEKHIKGGEKTLDIGTGSGILSIAAEKLGSSEIEAYDLDEAAVKVAKENFGINSCTKIKCGESDLLKNVEGRGFELVLANIVADIILRMLPDLSDYTVKGAKIIASGIISQRADNVVSAFEKKGYKKIDSLSENDWTSFVFEKQ